MTSVSAITNSADANYNAVKIKINDPKTTIPEGFKSADLGNYNAINIEVNRPTVDVVKMADIPAEVAVATFMPVEIPVIPVDPVAYEEYAKTVDEQEAVVVTVPEPNVTSQEVEKKNLGNEPSFNGLSFKSAKVEKPSAIKIDVAQTVANLKNENYDIQALQMEEMAKTASVEPDLLKQYITTDVFSSLIDILNKDTTNLEAPSKEQIEIRDKALANLEVLAIAQSKGEKLEETEIPYPDLTPEEINTALTLTSMEQAERNKEYAMYVIAVLSRTYADDVKKISGNTVPLTDLPGMAEIVDTLRYNKNWLIRIAAIDALQICYKPEYKEETLEILKLASQDKHPQVAQIAQMTYEIIAEKG